MKNLLEIKDLNVKFYTYEGVVEAIDNINLNLREEETLGLVGETGCGKSVSSLSVLVLVPPPGRIESGSAVLRTDSGAIDLFKQDDAYLRSVRGQDISMIFQEPRAALNPVFTVENQISEVFMHHRLKALCERTLAGIERDLQKEKLNPLRSFSYKLQRRIYQKMSKNPNAFTLRIISKIPIVSQYKRRLKGEVRKDVVRVLGAMKIPDPERVADMYPHELS